MFAKSLVELVQLVELDGRGLIEWRGRVFEADRSEIRARFAMGDELAGVVAAPWPGNPAADDLRAPVLRTLNTLVQRCAIFETCERAYQSVYGTKPA